MRSLALLNILFASVLLLSAQQPARPSPLQSGDSLTTDQSNIADFKIVPVAFVLYDGDKKVLSISHEGKITFGDGITPDEAARQFAAALERYGLRMCTEKPAPKPAKAPSTFQRKK